MSASPPLLQQRADLERPRCPDCYAPFVPGTVDTESRRAWCVACERTIQLPDAEAPEAQMRPPRSIRLQGPGVDVRFVGRRALSLSQEGSAVRFRVEGRTLQRWGGPFAWLRRADLDGSRVLRLRVVSARPPFFARERWFSGMLLHSLVADLRDGSQCVLASGFYSPAEPVWLARELTRALDLPEPAFLPD